jgi:hypothetical protein
MEWQGDIEPEEPSDKLRNLPFKSPGEDEEKKRNTDIDKAEEFYIRANDVIKKSKLKKYKDGGKKGVERKKEVYKIAKKW